jgi:hypothetical protein
MGKKAKTASGKKKAATRKLPKSELPPPPKPLDTEVCEVFSNYRTEQQQD